MSQIDPQAVRQLGYKVADLYAAVVEKANTLPENDRETLYRLTKNIFAPFVEGVEELNRLGQYIIVETVETSND